MSDLKIKKGAKGFFRRKKKTFYSMDDNCSSESSEDEDDELLFMRIKNIIPAEEVEGVVYIEA